MLASKYSPKNFDEIVGQKYIVKTLSRLAERSSEIYLPRTYLFQGPAGVGKTSIAHVYARSLEAKEADVDSAIYNTPERLSKALEAIRGQTTSPLCLITLEHIDALEPEALAYLAAEIERSTDKYMFVLTTTVPAKVPELIRSRAMVFNFTSIPLRDLFYTGQSVLISERKNFTDEGLSLIIRESNGSLRKVYNILDQMLISFDSIDLESYYELFGEDCNDLFARLVDSLYMFDGVLMEEAINNILERLSQPMLVLEKWMKFEVDLFNGVIRPTFEFGQSEEDKLARMELLWFMLDKVKSLNMDAHTILRMGCVFMSARLTRRITDQSEAFALLG